MVLRLAFARLVRGAALVVTTGTAAVGVGSLCRDPMRIAGEPLLHGGVAALADLSFEQVLTGGCALLLMACALWLALAVVLAVVVEILRGLRVGRRVRSRLDALTGRVCPVLVRALVATAVGALVTTTVTVTARADGDGDSSPGARPSGPDALTGLALPDRVLAEPRGPTVATAMVRGARRTLVVRPGDSLWSITARLLPRGAGDRRICTGWHRLYHANEDRIGADPDLIHPGTPLVVPDLSATGGKDQS